MGKNHKKAPEVSSANIRKIKIRMLVLTSALLLVFTIIVGVMGAESVHIIHDMRFRVINYVVFSAIYFTVAFTALHFAGRAYEKKIAKILDTDKLTSGINYEKFLDEAQKLFTSDNRDYAVFYGDIKNFKYINDTFGYDVGDRVLMSVSRRIQEETGKYGGLYARITADNYTVIVPYAEKNDFVDIIYSIIDDISWFEELQKENYHPEVYVGIYCTGDYGKELTISEMIDRANMAQKSIKGSAEYHIAFYTEEIRERILAEKELERHMEGALAAGEFKVYFQPKYNVSSGEIVGAEALVRWDSPVTGFMSPGKFIPLFEQNGFIIELDQYVFETVCQNMRDWIDSGIETVPVSVNVSRLQFYRIDFVKRYAKIKEKYSIPDGLLELEFTESIVFENLEILRKIVLDLKKSGFSCSIDDFGSGYSSLNILKNLPMDTLKLDRLFFNNSDNMTREKALVSSVITMARALDMKTVAEGIENWAQVAFLREIGCDIVQGFVYSEPIPHARFTHLLDGKRKKEMPYELRKARGIVAEESPEYAVSKYATIVGLMEGILIEVDFNTGSYKFLNVTDIRLGKDTPLCGENYDQDFSALIRHYVHPDDVKSVLDRCMTVSVMTSFYQKETKIITEMRIKTIESRDYEWSRLTIVRIHPDPDGNDFRALLFIEPTKDANRNRINDTELFVSIRDVMSNICALVYEFNMEDLTFRQLCCNTDLLGSQPENGEISWLHECYIPKIVAPEDREKTLAFADISNIKKHLVEGGEKSVSEKIRVTFNGRTMGCRVSISRMAVKDGTNEKFKFICLFNIEDME